jgi:hypothetical protein
MKLSVVEIAPGILENVPPWFVLSCHCTVGAGVPVAEAVNVTGVPLAIVWLVGPVATIGGASMIKVPPV